MADEKLPATISISEQVVREIAMDIGKAVVQHVEAMYPAAIEATPGTFKLSLRNAVYNEIIAAIAVTDEGAIKRRLAERKSHRRRVRALYRNVRSNPQERA